MIRTAALAAVAGLALTSAASAQWTTSSITDGDVRFQVGSGTTGGTAFGSAWTSATTSSTNSLTADFRTTGAAGTDHNFGQWWWYRTATDTRERNVASVAGSAAVTKTNTGTSKTEWAGIQSETTGVNSALRFTLSFQVFDLDGPGGNRGSVVSTLTVTNTGATAIDGVSLFHFVDYFFTGEDAGDQVLPGNFGSTVDRRYNIVTDATDTTVPSFGQLLHEGIGANGNFAGSFSAVGGQMTDTSIDNFSTLPVTGTGAAGDIGGVMQWDFGTIAAGGSATAVGIVTIIPAPGAMALAGLGGLLAARRRRA